MCRAASNAPTGFPKKRFSTSVTHNNPSPISTLSGTRVRRRAATEKLPHHFHQNRGNHGKKTGQQACCWRPKGPQNSIRSNNQQSVAAQKFHIHAHGNLRPLRPSLSRGEPRQRVHSLFHPAIIYPGEDRSGSHTRRSPAAPNKPGRGRRDGADPRNQPFNAALCSAVKLFIPRHWRRHPSSRSARGDESHPTPPREIRENRG